MSSQPPTESIERVPRHAVRWFKSKRSTLSRAGFTLLELIVVMSMLTVVIALAAPSLSGFFRSRTLDSEARRVLSVIRLGQTRAASEGVPMVFWVDPEMRRYGLREADGYSERDLKEIEFQMNQDLNFELLSTPRFEEPRQNEQSLPKNVSTIRFLPDGTFSESSLPAILLVRTNIETLIITQTMNRLSYEILPESNNRERNSGLNRR
jgi:type II secretion system protein H